MSNPTTEILESFKAARSLIEEPERWTKSQWARASSGVRVHAKSDEAVCWCVIGAVCRVYRGRGTPIEIHTALRAFLPCGFDYLPEYNDDPRTTHADILALFDRAIASLEDAQPPTTTRRLLSLG